MYSSYTLNTDELGPQFIAMLQEAYPGKTVEIAVQETSTETEYLLQDPVLLQSVANINQGKNLVAFETAEAAAHYAQTRAAR